MIKAGFSVRLLLLTFTLLSSATAQIDLAFPVHPNHSNSKRVDRFEETPFVQNPLNLAKNFRGHNFEETYKKLGEYPKRKEFEKSHEFDQRIFKWLQVPTVGSVRPGDSIALIVSDKGNRFYSLKYEPDTETFVGTLSFTTDSLVDDAPYWLPISINYPDIGAKPTTTRTGKNYMSALPRRISFGVALPFTEPITVEFSMPRDKAVKTKPLINAALIIEMVAPYKFFADDSKTLFTASPARIIVNYGLIGAAKELIFFNSATGEILGNSNELSRKATPVPPVVQVGAGNSPEFSTSFALLLCKLPEYPTVAMQADATGTSTLRATISKTGLILKIEVTKSSGSSREHRLLDRSAIQALEGCKFEPSKVDVERIFVINHTWTLNK